MPLDLNSEPNMGLIRMLESHSRDLWSAAHEKWSVVDSYTEGTYAIWGKNQPNRPGFHPAQPSGIISNAADALMASTPHVHREPPGRGKAHREKADKIEKWVGFAMSKAALMEPTLIWKRVNRHMAQYGYAVVEGPIIDYGNKPEEPERGDNELDIDWERRRSFYKNDSQSFFPFRIRVPHPARVLMDPTQKQPFIAIKSYSRYAYQLEELTQKKKAQSNKRNVTVFSSPDDNPFLNIPCYELWTDKWQALATHNELLYTQRNTWGFIPYAHAFAGWGAELTDDEGIQPEHLAVGLLDKVLDDLRMRAQEGSARHNAIIEAAFATRGTSWDEAEAANALKEDIVKSRPGDFWWMDSPQLPTYLFQEDATLAADIEEATYSRNATGHRTEGVKTVGQQAILTTLSSRKFGDPSVQREHLATITAQRLLRLVDIYGESITINGVTVGPKDLDGDYNVTVTFRDVDPVLQFQSRELGMNEFQLGLKSKQSYWAEDARREDGEEERWRTVEDAVLDDPQVAAKFAKAAAHRMGIDDFMDSMERGRGGTSPAVGGILGPDGQPLATSMGQGQIPGSRGNVQQVSNELRQGLTPQVPGPSRVRVGSGQ